MENQIREFTKKGNRRRLFKRVVSLLCVVVLLFTMNTLKRNANTLERIAMCGLQEHTHTAGCYNSSGELVCAIPEHVHTDACYQQSPSDDLVLNGDDLEIADGLVDAGDAQSLDLSLDLDQGDLLDFVQDSGAPASNVQDIGNDMPVLDGDLVFDTSYNNEETQQLAANTSVEEAQGAVDETQSEEAQQLLEEEQIAVEDGQEQPTGEGQEQISFGKDQEQPVEQPTEAAQEQPVEEETEQPVEEEQEQPVEEETEQPVEEAQEQPVEEETEQPVEGEQLVEEDQDQIAIEEQPVVAEQEQPVEEVQEQLVIEGQEEPVVEAQEEPVVEEQEEPVVEEQEEPVVEEQEEPVVEEQEEPVVEEQEEPVVEEQEEPVVEEQEEPAVEEQEEPVVEEQEEPVVEEQEEPVVEEQEEPVAEEQEEPVVEEQEEPVVEGQEEPVVEEQEEPVVEEQEEPVVEKQEEPAVEEQEEPAIEEQEEPAIEEAEQPTEEEAEQPAEEEAEQPTEEEAEQPAEEEAEQPAEEEAGQPTEEEAEQPAEEEAEQPAEEEAEQPAEEEAEQPAEEEAEQPTEEEAEQPAEENAEQPAEEEAEQPTEEEAEQPTEEEAEQPAEEEQEQPAEVESDPEAEGESEEEPEARIAYPAKQFRQGTAYINVSVDAPEGAFPEGTVMVVKDVEDQGTIDNIQQSVAEDFVEVTSVHAVDISFWYDDAEIEPLLPIAVVMSAVEAPNADHETVVVHVDDNGETQLVDSEATGAAEAALEMPAAADAEAQVFEADTFSVYALVTKQTIETKYIDDHGDTWRIKVDYGRDAKLPEGASLRVAEVTDETYLAQAEAALESGKRITKARFFDIKIMDGDREVQPDDQVQVTVTLEGNEGEIEATENQNDIGNPDVVAMHFVEQDDETVSVEKQSAVETDEGVVFHADGFSTWGVVYTVDFEYTNPETGETVAWKWPGEGSYAIADIMAEIGVTGEISDVSLERTEDVGGSARVLYLEEKDGAWYLTSEEAFHDTFVLSVVVDGKVYSIVITDIENTTNLNQLLTHLTVSGVQQDSSGNYLVKPGKPYSVDIQFDEKIQIQFSDTAEMCYTLPAGVTLKNLTSPFVIQGEDANGGFEVTGNTIRADGNKIYIKFNSAGANYARLAAINTAQIKVHADVVFEKQPGEHLYHIEGGGDFKVDSTASATVEKSGKLVNYETGKVEYTLKLTSDGDNDGITVKDTFTNEVSAMSFDTGSVKMYDSENNVVSGWNVTSQDSTGFTMNTGALQNGVYYIKYTATLDKSKLVEEGNSGAYGSGADTKNRVEYLDKSVEQSLWHVVEHKTGYKSAGQTQKDENTGIATTPWTIEAHSADFAKESGWKLTTVTDNIKTEGAHYSGDYVTVNIYDEVTGALVGTKQLTWAEVGVSNKQTATGWSYDMSELPGFSNAGKYWKYVITYTTEYNVSNLQEDVEIKNESTSNDPEPHTATGTVGPLNKNYTGLNKYASDVNRNEITWTIQLLYPSIGLSSDRSFVIENLPKTSDGKYVDTYVDGSFAFAPGSTYTTMPTIEKISEDQLKISWDGIPATSNGQQGQIIFTIKTKVNDDWMNDGDYDKKRVNTAIFDNITRTGEGTPMNPMLKKTGSSIYESNGEYYFYFSVLTNKINASTFPNDSSTITFTDTFDSNLEYVPGTARILGGYNNTQQDQSRNGAEYITPVIEGNTMTFTVRKSNIPTVWKSDSSGTWYFSDEYFQFYKLIYTMKVKDKDALVRAALSSTGYTAKLGNSIVSDLGGDETTVEYTPKILDKYRSEPVDGKIPFTIKVNETKLDLVENGDILVLTDTLQNLSVHYEDINVEVQDSSYESNAVYGTDESGRTVKLPYFNMNGNKITFYLPDGYYTLITYQAKAVGEADSNGYIHYHNTADLDGYEKYVDDYEKYSGEATGTATNYGVKLYKANGYVNSQKLAGAKFKLFIVDEVDEDGNIVSGTPMKNLNGTDYMVTSTATGDVLVQGDTNVTGWNLKPEQRYYLQEVVAPEGCAIDNTKYEFLISQKGYVNYTNKYIEAPDGSGAIIQPWTYFNGDILTVKNYPIKGLLDIKKTVSGTYTSLDQLNDDQKAAVKFEVYKQKDESWVKIKTITLAEFTSDTYTIGDLDAGTYKVEEVVNEDQHVTIKTYAVKAEADSVEQGQYATVVISEDDIHNVYHHEVDINNAYDTPSEFKLYKYGNYAGTELTDLKLSGAEFGVFAYESSALAAEPVKTYTTNSRGRLTVSPDGTEIKYDTIYGVKETKAPEGYQVSDNVYYIFFQAVGSSAQPSPATIGGKSVLVIPYKTASDELKVPNDIGTTELSVRKIWQNDTLDEDTEKNTPIKVKVYRTAYYNKACTVAEPTESGYWPNVEFTATKDTAAAADAPWVLSTEATLKDGVEIVDGKLIGLPTMKFLANGAPLYFKYTVVETGGADNYTPKYTYTTDEDGNTLAEVTNRPNTVKSMVTLKAKKKWVDVEGNDVTADMGLTDNVFVDVYRTTGVLNVGKIVENNTEVSAENQFSISLVDHTGHTPAKTSLLALPGDTIRVIVNVADFQNGNTIDNQAEKQQLEYNGRYSGNKIDSSYFHVDAENGCYYWEFTVDSNYTSLNYTYTSGQINSIVLDAVNVTARDNGRTQVLTQEEAAAIGGTKVQTLELNKQNRWQAESDEFSGGTSSTVYSYYLVEPKGASFEAEYTVDGDTVTVTNVDKKLKVDKKWFEADGTSEITNKTDGEIVYNLYRVAYPVAWTTTYSHGGSYTVDYSNVNTSTSWDRADFSGLTGEANDGKIKAGSKIKLEIEGTDASNQDLTGAISVSGGIVISDTNTLFDVDKGGWTTQYHKRTIVIDNVSGNVVLSGEVLTNVSLPIRVTVLGEPTGANGPTEDEYDDVRVGQVTMTYDTATIDLDEAFAESNIKVKAGDHHWTSIISKLPESDPVTGDTYTYYITEESVTGFELMSIEPNNVRNGSTVLIKNKEVPTGTLTVKKVIEGASNANNKTYHVTVRNGSKYVTANGSLTDTVTQLPVSASNPLVLRKLSLGTYVVNEVTGDGNQNVNLVGYDFTSTGGDLTGSVTFDTSNLTGTVTVTNKYEEQPGSLKIKKNVTVNGQETNGTLADGTYTFTLRKEGDTENTTGFTVSDGTTTTENQDSVTVTISGGVSKTVTVSNLEAGNYIVTEAQSINGTSLVGDNDVEVTVTAGDTAEVQTAEFTNNKPYTTAHPQVTKAVTAAGYGTDVRWPDGVDFDFDLSFVSAKDGENNIDFSMADQTKKATKANKTAVFDDIAFTEPGVYTFTITEQEPQNAQAYITYDTEQKTVTVTVTADGNGNLTPAISYGGADTLTVNNVYTANGTAQFSARKTANDQLGDRTFQFQLLDGNDNVLQTSTAVTQGQTAIFNAISYDLSNLTETADDKRTGTFTYKIKEVIPNDAQTVDGKKVKDGVIYDETVHTVIVTVTDTGNGTLDVKYKGSDTFTVPGFNNTYDASGKTTFEGVKEIENRKFKNGDALTVSITSSDGGKLPTDANGKTVALTAGQNTADFAFAEVTYNYADIADSTAKPKTKTFHYTVTETATMDGTTADTRTHTIEVTVTDNGDGTLKVDKVYKADTTAEEKTRFVNTFDTSIKAQIKGTKAVTNGRGDDYLAGYQFKLTADTGVPMPSEGGDIATSGNDGSFAFGEVTYTMNMVKADNTAENGVYSKEYTYTVTEQLPEGADAATSEEQAAGKAIRNNMEYDIAPKQVTVTVTYDEATGGMTQTVSPTQAGFEITNVQLGELEITKSVVANGKGVTKSGTFWYAVFNANDVQAVGVAPNQTLKPIMGRHSVSYGSIVVDASGKGTATVPDLPYGDYYVFELSGEPTEDKDGQHLSIIPNGTTTTIGTKVYTVTGSGTTAVTVGENAGQAELTNTVPETSITGQKTWKPYTSDQSERKNPVNTTLTLTLTRYTVNGSTYTKDDTFDVHQVSISANAEGKITLPDGKTIDEQHVIAAPDLSTEAGVALYQEIWSYTWNNLPLYGNSTDVKYAYMVNETVTNDWFSRQAGENSGYLPDANGNTTQQFTNVEKSPVSLPSTGGVGTGVVYGAGAALVLLAVLGMILTKRKRTDGEGIR